MEGHKSEAKPGDWVQIRNILLNPAERPKNLPEDTKKVPLEMLVKGFTQEVGKKGETVTIKTPMDRKVTGQLVDINPSHDHHFGTYPPQLLDVGLKLRKRFHQRETSKIKGHDTGGKNFE